MPKLLRLGVGSSTAPRRGRKIVQANMLNGRAAQACAAGERKIAAQFRGPNGEEYSGRGAIPRWARDLGVCDRAGLEKYRIR